MKRKFLLFLCVFFTAISISACSGNYAKKPLFRAVTNVDISCQHRDTTIHRHYTNNEKMQAVLIYIRLADNIRVPDNNPEKAKGDIYEIRVQLSDGQQHIYKQKDHRYFYQHTKGWRTLDPEHAAKLYGLLRQYPSDELSA